VLLVGQWLGQEMLSMLPSYQLLIETTCSSLAQYLEDFRLPTEAEQQQLQAVHVDLGCSCDVCRQVAAFLQDGTCTSTDVEVKHSSCSCCRGQHYGPDWQVQDFMGCRASRPVAALCQ